MHKHESKLKPEMISGDLTIVISIDQKQYNGFSDLFRIEKSNIR